MGNKRVFYMDALRAFAIFCVVMLHVCAMDFYSFSAYSLPWQIINFYDSLLRFCVPVFIMLSGALFLDAERNYTIKDIFTKKIFRVAVAFLFWSFMYLVICKDAPVTSAADFINRWLTGGRYHLWFPFTIIGLYIISPILKEVCKSRKTSRYFIILWFIFQSLGTATILFPNLPQTFFTLKSFLTPSFMLGYSGYFVLGHYLCKYDFSKKMCRLSYIGALLGIAVTMAGTYYMSFKTGVGYEMFYEYTMPNNVITSIGVFLFFKYNITGENLSKGCKSLIILISRLSFGIYLLHDMFIYVMKHHFGISTGFLFPALSIPVCSVIIFILSIVAVSIISKIPILKKYII